MIHSQWMQLCMWWGCKDANVYQQKHICEMIIWYIEKSKTKSFFHLFNNKLSSLNYVKIIISFKWCNIFKIIFNLMKNSYDKNKHSYQMFKMWLLIYEFLLNQFQFEDGKTNEWWTRRRRNIKEGNERTGKKPAESLLLQYYYHGINQNHFVHISYFILLLLLFLDNKKLDINFVYYSI